ncbi:MAG: sodium:proton antiporter [Clostridiales bacterium]|nr:sodium:proton antiporter [Clostridiales bacterium]
MYESVYEGFLLCCMIVIGVLIILCLIRAVLGPRLADRIVATNMIGTMTIVEIAILALYMRESYLFDVCLIYAMISFLAVVVLTKIYEGAYQEKKITGHLSLKETDDEEEDEV